MRILLECDGPLHSVIDSSTIARDLAARGHDVWVKTNFPQAFGDDPRILTYDPDYYPALTFDRRLKLNGAHCEKAASFLRQIIGNPSPQPEVFVTGTRGFAGRYIAECLRAQDFPLHYHSRQASDLSIAHIFPREIVIHCAAAAGPWHSASDIARDNIAATRNLVTQAKDYGTKLFIFLSSTSIYGKTPFGVLAEDCASRDANTYGVSKFIGEQLIKEAEFPAAVLLRCPGIIGPGSRGTNWLVRLATALQANETVELYNSDAPFNNCVHVTDVAAFIAQIITQRDLLAGWSAFNICADASLTIRQAAELMRDRLSSSSEFYEAPASTPSFLLSNEKAKFTGWRPMTVSESIELYARELRQ